MSRSLRQLTPSPRSRKSAPGHEETGAKAHWATSAAGIGTLLAGLAAVLAVVVAAVLPDNPAERSEGPPSVGSSSPPAAVTVDGFSSLAAEVQAHLLTQLPESASPYEYRSISADDGRVSFLAPVTWSDRETTSWLDDQDRRIGAAAIASTHVDGLYADWVTPGVFLGVAPYTEDPARILASREQRRAASCAVREHGVLDGPDMVGEFTIWSKCTGGAAVLDVAANWKGGAGTSVLFFRALNRQDLAALGKFGSTLQLDFGSVAKKMEKYGQYLPGSIIN